MILNKLRIVLFDVRTRKENLKYAIILTDRRVTHTLKNPY